MPEQDPFAYLQKEDADPFSYLSQPATAPDPFAYLAQSVGPSESAISAVSPGSSALGGIPSLFAQAAESGLKSFPAFASMMAGGAGQMALGAGKLGLGMAPGFVQRVGNVALAPLEVASGIASQYGRETLEEESRRQYNLTQAAKAAGLGPVGTGILRGVAYAPDAMLQVGTGALGMLGRGLIRAGTKPFARAAMAEGVAKNTVGDIAREIAERRPAGAVPDLEPVGPAAAPRQIFAADPDAVARSAADAAKAAAGRASKASADRVRALGEVQRAAQKVADAGGVLASATSVDAAVARDMAHRTLASRFGATAGGPPAERIGVTRETTLTRAQELEQELALARSNLAEATARETSAVQDAAMASVRSRLGGTRPYEEAARAEAKAFQVGSDVARMEAEAVQAGRPVASWLLPERAAEIEPWQRDALAPIVGDRIIAEAESLRRVGREAAHRLEGRHQASLITRLARDWGARPEVLTEYLGREVNELVVEGVGRQGRRRYLGMQQAHHDYLKASLEDASGFPLKDRKAERWLREHVDLPTNTHGTLSITRDEATHLLAMLKDPDNRAAILRDGLWLKRMDLPTPVRLTQAQLDSFGRSLAQSGEGRLAQSGFDRMPVAAGELNQATRRVLGEDVASRENYYPRARHKVDGDAPLATFSDLRKRVLDSMGFLKERTGGDAPIILRNFTDDFVEHVDDSSRFAGYLEPVTIATENLGRADVAESLKAVGGEGGFNRIMEAIDLEAIPLRLSITGDSKVRALMRHMGAGILGFRVSPALMNPAGLAVSAAYESGDFLRVAKSLASGSPSRMKEVNEIATRFSPAWRDRYEHGFMHQVTAGLADTSRRRFGPKTVDEIALGPLEFSDRAMATVRWDVAERKVAEAMPELAPGSDEFYTKVAAEWERLIARGENTANGMELSGALALGRRNPWFGSMVMFQSASSKAYSLLPRAAGQLAKGDVRGAMRSLTGFTLSTMYSAWTRTLVKFMRGKVTAGSFDPRSEQAKKDFLKTVSKEAAGNVPVFGNLFQSVARKAMGEGFFQFPTGTLEGALMDAGRGMADMIGAIEDQLQREYDQEGEPAWIAKYQRAMGELAEVAATARGIPYGGTKDLLEIIRNTYEGIKEEAPDLASALLESDSDYDAAGVSKAGNKLWAAVRDGNSALFREALQDRKRAGGKMRQSYIISSIRSRGQFSKVAKYESDMFAGIERNKERAGLSNDAIEAADTLLAQRDQMIEMAIDLARENDDLLTGFTGDGQDFLDAVREEQGQP